MGFLSSYCLENFNSIIISKVSTGSFSFCKKIILVFLINTKQYKKNILLFYIILSVLFGGVNVIKQKIVDIVLIVKLVITKNPQMLIQNFIQFYLPILGSIENSIKLGFFCINNNIKQTSICYRITYKVFPVIPELDFIYEEYEHIYNIVSSYRVQLDMVIKSVGGTIYNIDLINMYRLPYIIKVKNNL